MIEELGESFVRMTIDYESAEIGPDVKEKLKMQLDKVEKEKAEQLEKYLSKKKNLKVLIEKKKEELVNHMEITNKYLGSYWCEVKRQEKEAIVNLVLECEQEEEELKEKKRLERQASIVLNTTEHYRTSFIYNYDFFSFFFYRVKLSIYLEGREKSMTVKKERNYHKLG